MRHRSSSPAVAYSKLHDHEKAGYGLPPLTTRIRHTSRSSLLFAVCAILFAVSSIVFFSRRLGHEVRDILHHSGPPGKHLVIASFKDQDVEWMKDVPSSWTPYRYFLDDPNPPNNLSVPQNLGREAMAYLTYIIDHYDNLPDYMIFTHGHDRSWHQVEPLAWKIRALNLTALEREGYISLRCEDAMGCENRPYIDLNETNWPGEWTLPHFWEAVIPDLPMPKTLSYKCCAQFAVSRRAIKQHPLSLWQKLRDPLLQDLEVLKKETIWGAGPPEINDWSVGTFWEKIWHAVLSGQSDLCPSVDTCHLEYFSNAILCAGGTELTVWNILWEDVKCVSAFEGVAPDEEPNWEDWYKPKNLYSQWARVHTMRSDAYRDRDIQVGDARAERDRLKDDLGKQQKILDHRNRKIKELEERLTKLGHKA